LLASGGVGATVRIWDSSGHHRHKLEDASSSSEVEFEVRGKMCPFYIACFYCGFLEHLFYEERSQLC